MTLSVCCLAGAPGPQVRALLEPLREVADEIVIAADARLEEATLAEYDAVADKLLRAEVLHGDHHHQWMHSQCSGEWILHMDADEVASPALVAAIPELVQDRGVRQHWLPRRWLYPDTGSWLDEPPWWPDYQLRLYRNDCLLRFAGELLHGGAVSQPPETYLESPLYHLNLISTSTEQREAKVASYDAIRPRMEAPGGGAMNRRYYLPEYASALELSAVPDDDRLEIERVLSASAVDASGVLDSPIPVTTLAETDLSLEGRPFEADVHHAEIVPVENTIRMMPGEDRAIHFRVTNLGRAAWPWQNPEIYPGRQVRSSLPLAEGERLDP